VHATPLPQGRRSTYTWPAWQPMPTARSWGNARGGHSLITLQSMKITEIRKKNLCKSWKGQCTLHGKWEVENGRLVQT
jgi:hypothetical protein